MRVFNVWKQGLAGLADGLGPYALMVLIAALGAAAGIHWTQGRTEDAVMSGLWCLLAVAVGGWSLRTAWKAAHHGDRQEERHRNA